MYYLQFVYVFLECNLLYLVVDTTINRLHFKNTSTRFVYIFIVHNIMNIIILIALNNYHNKIPYM